MSDRWTIPPIIIHRRFSAAELAGETLGWHLLDYSVPAAWPHSQGEAVTVGICDTGIDQNHSTVGDLAGTVKAAKDFTGSRYGYWDRMGHGSHVAGIVGALVQNGIGVAGVAPKVRFCIAKGLGDSGSGSSRQVAGAIDWLVSQRVDIINMSLGSPQASSVINASIERAFSAGIIVVCAAGNDGGPVNSPGDHPQTIGVSAVDQNRQIASFSSRGAQIDCGAPGVEIRSTITDGMFAVYSGTSMATPYVVGCLALKIGHDKAAGKQPFRTRDEAIAWLTTKSDDVGAPGTDPLYGVGLPKPGEFFIEPPPTPPGNLMTWIDGRSYKVTPVF